MSYLQNLKRNIAKKTVTKLDPPRDLDPGRVVCPTCGTCSDVDLNAEPTDGNWLPCVAPEGFEWKLPSGKIVPVVGDPIYLDALGDKYDRKAYMIKYNIDPEIAYTKMRAKTS